MMQASAFEYRHRYLVHGLIYGLCFAAPWTPLLPVPYRAPMWDFVQNGSIWFHDREQPVQAAVSELRV